MCTLNLNVKVICSFVCICHSALWFTGLVKADFVSAIGFTLSLCLSTVCVVYSLSILTVLLLHLLSLLLSWSLFMNMCKDILELTIYYIYMYIHFLGFDLNTYPFDGIFHGPMLIHVHLSC